MKKQFNLMSNIGALDPILWVIELYWDEDFNHNIKYQKINHPETGNTIIFGKNLPKNIS